MGRLYNFLFNSKLGTGTIESKTYFVDWSMLPSGQYKGCFSFVSASGTISVACCNIFMDLGQELSYPAMGVTGSQLSSGYFYIGSAGATAVAASSYVYCTAADNPPFTLLNRPSQNQVTIRILQNDTNQTAYTPDLAYSLTLSLELLD
jgi:hypothetical protein